jgi:hypothetical protein
MNCAPRFRIIKDAVAITGLHLHHRTGNPPESLLSLLATQPQGVNHSFLIPFVEGNSGFPVAAESAAGALKNVGDLAGLYRIIVHGKKKRRSTGAGVVKEKERQQPSVIKRSR